MRYDFFVTSQSEEANDEEKDQKIDLRMHMDRAPYTIQEVRLLRHC